MNLLKLSQIKLDRKQLSEIASNSPGTFNALLEKVTKNP
jgi:ribosomal protein L20